MNTGKPILLLFIDWFSPGYKAGGPVTSALNFIHLLKQEYNIYVFTSDTDLGELQPYPGIEADKWLPAEQGSFQVYYARKSKISGGQIKKVIQDLKPDFVYLNHLFSPWFVVYPLWLKWKKFYPATVVVSPRGALFGSALAVKPYKKMPFLKIFKWLKIPGLVRFHATSEREKEAVLHYFPGSRVWVADDLPNTLQPTLQLVNKQPGLLKCIFLARLHPIKNLDYVIEAIKPIKISLQLSIVGPIEDEAYWNKCKEQIHALPSNITVDYKGALPNHQLQKLIQEHHLLILPTQGENFGHAIFETFLAGRPVIISDQTPWQDLESLKIGWDLPLDQPEAFTKALGIAGQWGQDEFNQYCDRCWQYAKAFIANPELKQQYRRLFS